MTLVSHARPLTHLALCSGYGGLDLALWLTGLPVRTVAHAEQDSHAADTLVARMSDQTLDQAPIWSDIESFDGGPWRGRVDLVTAGIPCPDFSIAGQRRGVHGDHWLWPVSSAKWHPPSSSWRTSADLFSVTLPASGSMRSGVCSPRPPLELHMNGNRLWLLAHREQDRAWVGGGAVADPKQNSNSQDALDRGLKGTLTDRPVRMWRTPIAKDEQRLSEAPIAAKERSGRSEVTSLTVQVKLWATPTSIVGQSRLEQTPRDARDRPGCASWPPLFDDTGGWAEWISQGGPEPQVRRST